jgi:aminobenzoyl-glutamate utilization protein B
VVSGEVALKWIEDHESQLIGVSDKIWDLAEVGLQENESAALLQKLLAENDFSVQAGVSGMPSAFVATWGSGKPVIGFLGEYDALPGLSQKRCPTRDPVKSGAPGHGCGHNLLGTAAAASAIAAKKDLESRGLPGTVKYFGCPAEELLTGKSYMAKDGVYDGLDAAITWHPGSTNGVRMSGSTAMNSAKFKFYGQTAHAAGSPHMGRSALDACVLMDMGVNYLREHIIMDARIHSVITNGGGEPNVVPAFSEIWYYVRAPRRRFLDEIYERVVKIANAAAMMTDTTMEIEFLTGCAEYVRLDSLGKVFQRALVRVGPPKFTDEERAYAKELAKSFAPGSKEKSLLQSHLPASLIDVDLHEEILELQGQGQISHGSSDVGDVSYVTPTVEIGTACDVLGTPGHSWQYTATTGMGIGHKGMIVAARAMAVGALDLFENQSLIDEAHREWEAFIAKNPYQNPIPKDQKPNLDVVKGH